MTKNLWEGHALANPLFELIQIESSLRDSHLKLAFQFICILISNFESFGCDTTKWKDQYRQRKQLPSWYYQLSISYLQLIWQHLLSIFPPLLLNLLPVSQLLPIGLLQSIFVIAMIMTSLMYFRSFSVTKPLCLVFILMLFVLLIVMLRQPSKTTQPLLIWFSLALLLFKL